MRYLGGVAGTAALSALLVDPASASSHQAPVFLYAAALGTAMLLAFTLPGQHVEPAAPVERAANAE